MDSLKSAFADVSERLMLESRIRDGARNMLQILDTNDANEALRSQVERELAVAEEHVQSLQTRRQSIEITLHNVENPAIISTSRFRRPRAIRAVHGLEDLNTHHNVTCMSPDPFVLPESQTFRLPLSNETELKKSIRAVDMLTRILKHDMSTTTALSPNEQSHIFLFLSTLYAQMPELRYDSHVNTLMLCALHGMSEGKSSTVRAYAIRLLRYIQSPDLLPSLASYTNACTVFLSRALTLEDNFAFEREQALKLVRAWIQYMRLGSHHVHALLSEGIVRVLSSIALEPEDTLYHASVETLAELVVLDTPLVSRSSAMAPLWRAICESRATVAVPLVDNMLVLLDRPSTRRHISAGTDLEAVLADFTTVPGARRTPDRLETTQQVISHLLQSWQGLFYLCMQDKAALKALVASLHLDDDAIRSHVLAALLPVFRTSVPLSKVPHLYVSYMSFVLVLLLDVGLWDALLFILQHAPVHHEQARALLARALQLSRDVLPKDHATLNAFPELVHRICLPDKDPACVVGASHALGAIDACERTLMKVPSVPPAPPFPEVPVDDVLFRTLLRDSMVTSVREYTSWNQKVILDLLDGPLWDPRRFDEALVGSKFVRRLLAFYRPSHARYSALKKSDVAHQWTHIGVRLCRVLLHHSDGPRAITEERLLSDLRDAFEQSVQHTDSLFSPPNVQHTQVNGYFDILAVFFACTTGQEMLMHSRLYTPWFALCQNEDDASVYIMCQLLSIMDLSSSSMSRILLERALTEAPETVRLAATKRLTEALWLDNEPQAWAVSLLLTQILDHHVSVQEFAIHQLEQACRDPVMAQCAMQQGPPIELLARNTLFALLGLAEERGLTAMQHAGLLGPLAQVWYAREHIAYVARAEASLMKPSELPPHLYGQLARTPKGCAYLVELNVLPEWHDVLVSHACEAYDISLVARVKAALWACGHIGASNHGVDVLASHGLLNGLFGASQSPVVSVRGTLFFVCSLFTQCERGREVLASHGWTCSSTACLPRHRRTFVTLGASSPAAYQDMGSRLVSPRDEHEAHAAYLMAQLGNGVVAGSARRALLRSRKQCPSVFRQVPLLGRALHMMDHYSFRLAARRNVWSLLDECTLSLDTIKLLQQWRSANVATAPAVPPRRSHTAKNVLNDENTYTTRLYPVLSIANLRRQVTQAEDHVKARNESPTKRTDHAPVELSSASRHQWPRKMYGFV